MKRIITMTILLNVYAYTGKAQQSGIVHYDRVIHMKPGNMDDIPENIRALMPKETTEKKILLFTPARSLYKNDAVKEAPPQKLSAGGMVIRMQTSTTDESLFRDFDAKHQVFQQELVGRTFLISDEWPEAKWKMTGNQKSILGHPVMEATTVKDKDTITAWFTTDFPVPAGPEYIGGLPGLILEASFGDNMSVKATAIEAGDAGLEKKIKEPTRGKKVTSQQFAEIQRQKSAEMKSQFSGAGTDVVIQTIGN